MVNKIYCCCHKNNRLNIISIYDLQNMLNVTFDDAHELIEEIPTIKVRKRLYVEVKNLKYIKRNC